MRVFREQLASLAGPTEGRTWVYVPYDQLTDGVGPLNRLPPEQVGIVLVESLAKGRRRPYHKQKLALVLANQRQFALEQARRGGAVDHRFTTGTFAEALTDAITEHGPLRMMEAAERELREELGPVVESGGIVVEPHAGWLSKDADFDGLALPWRMDAFYRRIRRRTGLLMEGGKPEGGRFSFDGDNRKPWKGEPPAPTELRFEPDAVTAEVIELVRTSFADHPGTLDPTSLPTTAADAERVWQHALTQCLPNFGTYEDAMSTSSRGLFHTRIAPLLNLHRLLPERVVQEVASSSAPLNSREGFVRQILGWREFVRHVHRRTDGMRRVGDVVLNDPLDRDRELPAAFWEGAPSGLRCLDLEVQAVWETGWTHHIPRLMVLANIATLLDVRPDELSHWFWVGFVDAFDWVVEPNVIGMGTYGVGALMTTKPYIAGANYVAKMGDACKGCAFHPKKTCPLTPMYWAFLARHAAHLSDNDRMKLPMASLRKRSDERKAHDEAVFDWVRRTLDDGGELDPTDVPRP